MLGETDTHWPTLQALLANAKTSGPAVHDARIAALCLQDGVREPWSADRDFRRHFGLKVVCTRSARKPESESAWHNSCLNS